MNAICGDCFANVAIRSCFVDTIVEFRCIRRVSQKRFHDSTSRFPPLAPAGCCSPASAVLSRRYDSGQATAFGLSPPSPVGGLSCFPPQSVAVVWRYLSVHSFCSLPDGRVSHQGLELVTRYLQPGSHRGNDRISQVPGEPQLSVCTCSNPTPAGLLAPDHYGAAAWPLVEQKQRLLRKVFRSSIAWLSDWLSTLRRTGYPATTQDSLPAAGQALPDGLSTRRIPMKGFRFVSYISSPFPKLLGAISSTGFTNGVSDRPRSRV